MKKRVILLMLFCFVFFLAIVPTGSFASDAELGQIEYVVNLLSASRQDFSLLSGTVDLDAMRQSVLSALLVSRRYESHYGAVPGYPNFHDSYSRADYNEIITGVFGQSADAFPELLSNGVFGFEAMGYIADSVRVDSVLTDGQGYYHAYGTVLDAFAEDGPIPVKKPYYHAVLQKSDSALFGFYLLAQETSAQAIPTLASADGTADGSDDAWRDAYMQFLATNQEEIDFTGSMPTGIALRDFDQDGIPELLTGAPGYIENFPSRLYSYRNGAVAEWRITDGTAWEMAKLWSCGRYQNTQTGEEQWLAITQTGTGEGYDQWDMLCRFFFDADTLTVTQATLLEYLALTMGEKRYTAEGVAITAEDFSQRWAIALGALEQGIPPVQETEIRNDREINGPIDMEAVRRCIYGYTSDALSAPPAAATHPPMPDGITPALISTETLAPSVEVSYYGFGNGMSFPAYTCSYPVLTLADPAVAERIHQTIYAHVSTWQIGEYCLGISTDAMAFEVYEEDTKVFLVGNCLFINIHTNVGGSGFETMQTFVFRVTTGELLDIRSLFADWQPVLDHCAALIWASDEFQHGNTPYCSSGAEIAAQSGYSAWLTRENGGTYLHLWYGSMAVSRHPAQISVPLRELYAWVAWNAEITLCCGEKELMAYAPLAQTTPPPVSPSSVKELEYDLIASDTRGKSTLDHTSTYVVDHLWDGDDQTSWQTKDAVGAYLQAMFYAPVTVTQVRIKNGYWKSDNRYYRNNRVRELEVSYRYEERAYDDYRDAERFTLADDGISDWQTLTLTPHENTQAVRLTILSVYPAQEYNGLEAFPEDTAINELRLLGVER